jgi:tetratricopeptide (TPR) repeat protein
MLRSLTCCSLLLLALALLPSCASDEQRYEEHLAVAETYREQGRTKEAAIELRAALKLQPKSADVNMRLADLLRESGANENAVFFYREAHRLNPQWLEPLLGELPLVAGDDRERAEEIVLLALELAPEDSRVHQRRADLALMHGNTEDALAAALTAVELGDNPFAQLTLGQVYQAMMREKQIASGGKGERDDDLYRSALRAFEQADRGDAAMQARVERARTISAWGSPEEADLAFDAALALAIEEGDGPRRLLIAEEIATRARRHGDVERQRRALEVITGIDVDALGDAERVALGAPERRVQSAWRALAELAEREEPGDGAAVLERLIQEQPERVSSHRLYARFQQRHGRTDDALAHLEATAEAGIAPTQMLDEAVRIALQNGDGQRANGYVERLAAEHPGDPYTLLARARLGIAMRRFGEASELLQQVNQLAESAESQRMLAQASFRQRRMEAAQEALDRSLELDPRSPASLRLGARIQLAKRDWSAVLQLLARLRAAGFAMESSDRLLAVRPLYQLGRPQAGRRILEELLGLDPPPPGTVIVFVQQEGARQPERALELLERALADTPANPPLINQAVSLDLQAGETDRALARLDRAIEKRPDLPILLATRAQVYLSANRLDEAERDARQAFERSPSLPGVPELILSVYKRQGRIDVAIEQLEASESAGLLEPHQRVLLARLYLQRGDDARAEALLEAALAENSGLAGAKNDLAYLLAREGRDLDRALELALEAQQALGENVQVFDTVGYVMLRRGLAGPAADQLSHALRLAEEQGQNPAPSVHYHMGLALRALGQEKEAADHLERALTLDPGFPEAGDAKQQLEAARAAANPPPSS